MAIIEPPQAPAGESDGDPSPVLAANGFSVSKTKLRPHAAFHAHRRPGRPGVAIWSLPL
jgi:hypothetical protein